jgi:hypothetical protein
MSHVWGQTPDMAGGQRAPHAFRNRGDTELPKNGPVWGQTPDLAEWDT